MEKIKIALCDCDSVYCERFFSYMMKHKAQETDLHIYSAVEADRTEELKDFDVVLAGSGFEQLKSQPNMIYLSDASLDTVGNDGIDQTGSGQQKKVVSKYQTMEQLLHEIYIRAGYLKKERTNTEPKSAVEVIGVCSPAGHEMQELFSILYAVNLKRQKRVLYLNFLEFSGFTQMFGKLTQYDMGDMILRLRNGTLYEEMFWNSIGELSSISYVQPFENPENIKQMHSRDFEKFFTFLQENTEFTLVVIDFGMSMPQLSECLTLCDTIFLPGKEGYFYRCREEAFLEWLEKTGQKELAEKVQPVLIPYSAKGIRAGGSVIEQLQWSEFGDFVRRYSGKRGDYADDDRGNSDS